MYKIIIEGETFEGNSIEELASEAADFVRRHICNANQIIDIDLVDREDFETDDIEEDD